MAGLRHAAHADGAQSETGSDHDRHRYDADEYPGPHYAGRCPGTQLANPAMQAAYQNMVADAKPEFYIEHLKRLRQQGIQPMFAMAHIHTLEAIEHLIRTGVYMGPLNHTMTAIGGAGGCGRNPFDFMEWVRRSPQGSIATYESLWRTVAPYAAMAVALGIHMRVGIEDNLWRKPGQRMTSVEQVEQVVRLANELGRKVATGGRSAPDAQNRHLVRQP